MQRTAKKFLRFEHPTAKKFLRFYHAAAKKFLRFPGLKLKRLAISRKKNFFLRTQQEVLAHALFLGCTVFFNTQREILYLRVAMQYPLYIISSNCKVSSWCWCNKILSSRLVHCLISLLRYCFLSWLNPSGCSLGGKTEGGGKVAWFFNSIRDCSADKLNSLK